MGLFASSILVKYSLLNNSGSLVYAGNSSLSLRIWGAQLELAEYSEDILNDYIQNYRYTRTTGVEHNFIGLRFGTGAGGDPSTDFILIGGTSGNKHTSFGLEFQSFFVDKQPSDSVGSGQQSIGDNLESKSFFIHKTPGINDTKFSLDPNLFTAIAWNSSGGFVATLTPRTNNTTGTTNSVFVSESGSTWRKITTGFVASWNNIISGRNGYLVVAESTSQAVIGNAAGPKLWRGGNNWSSVTLPVRADQWCMASSPDVYVLAPAYATTSTSIVIRSHNGITWSSIDTNISANWAGITWCSSLSSFALIAHNTSLVLLSQNAINWTSSDLGLVANWQDIAASTSTFVAIAAETSTAVYSQNGTSWATTALPFQSTWLRIVYDNDVFKALNHRTSGSAQSFNGIDWTIHNNYNGLDAAYGNGRWVYLNQKYSRWNRNVVTEADFDSDLFNKRTWYQLVSKNYTTYAERTFNAALVFSGSASEPQSDWVTIGENSNFRTQPSESHLENTKFFSTLKPEEGISVPRIPQYDAEQLMELFYNKSGRVIDSQRYTTTTGLYNYLDTENWFSITPPFDIPEKAFDEYGNSPVYALNDVEILDVTRNIKQIVKLIGNTRNKKLRYATNLEFLFGPATPYVSSDAVTLQEYFVRGFINNYPDSFNAISRPYLYNILPKQDLFNISDELLFSLFRALFVTPDSFTLDSRIDSFVIQTTLYTNQDISDEIILDFSVLELFDQEDDATGIEYDLENIIDPSLDLNV